MTKPTLQSVMSQKTVLTIFVTLFFVSLFILILMRWNKSTEDFTVKPGKNTNKTAKFTSRKELFENPEIKAKAQDVFAALEAFSAAKNNAEGITATFKNKN